jgi:hypothetical protein
MQVFSVLHSSLSPLPSTSLFKIHKIFIVLFLFSLSEFVIIHKANSQSQFSIYTSVDNVHPHGFCDIITFTIGIINTGSASSFSGKIEFYNNQWQVIDYSNLPNSIPDIDSDPFGISYINFSFSLSADSHIEYTYQLIANAYSNNGVQFTRNHMTRDANNSSVYDDRYIAAYPYKEIPWPGYSSIHASDLLDDYANGGFLTLIPLDPAPGNDYYACNDAYSQSLYVKDQLIFDIPEYCIYNGQNTGGIIVEAGGQIIIQNGANLLIDGQTIRSCHQMWKGFYVEQGGTLTLSDCVIENAQYGIEAERGASINLTNTVFLNNYIGLYIPSSSEPLDPDHPEDSYVVTKLTNNLFIGEGEMLPPYDGQTPDPATKPFAGIVLSDVSSFEVEGFVYSGNGGYSNYFENLANGVIATNSVLYVGDVFFKNIEYDPSYPNFPQGHGILVNRGIHTEINGNTIGTFSGYNEHFDHVTTAIQSTLGSINVNGMVMESVGTGISIDQAKNKRMEILSNTISGTDKGILLDHCFQPFNTHPSSSGGGLVAYNSIDISGNGDESSCIEMNDFPIPTWWNITHNYLTIGDGKYGIINRAGEDVKIHNNTINADFVTEDDKCSIYLEGSKKAQVTCNNLLGDADFEEHNFHESDGISFQGANGFDISCNEISGYRYGIRASSDNSGGSLLRGNNIGSQWDGLLLGITGVIGSQPPDPDNDKFHGNIWSGTYYDFDAVHNGPADIVLKSKIYYDKNDNAQFEPLKIDAVAKWFYNEPGESFICENEDICPEGIGGFQDNPTDWDSLDVALAAGNLGYPYFDNPISWAGRLFAYRRLHDSGITLPSSLSSFLSSQENLNIGKFSNAYDSLHAAIRFNGALSSIYNDFPNDVSRIFYEIRYLDSLITEETYDRDSLSELIRARNDSIFYLLYDYHVSDSIVHEQITERIDNASDYISSIVPDSSWEENLQFTLLEFLHLAMTDTLLSSTDLYNLALNCPDRYCDPVYHARSLIREDSTINYYPDDDLCDYIAPRSLGTNSFEIVSAFPNPATNFVSVNSSLQGQKIEVFDINGHLITLVFSTNLQITTFNISVLPTGIYFIRIFDKRNEMQILKFAKI